MSDPQEIIKKGFNRKQAKDADINFDQVPPSDISAERAVLGAALIEEDGYVIASEFIKGADFFYQIRHQHIWRAIELVAVANGGVDVITIAAKIKELGLEAAFENNVYHYLCQLMNVVASSAHTDTHAALVTECYIKRRQITAAKNILIDAYDAGIDAFDSLDAGTSMLDEISAVCNGITEISWAKMVEESADDMIKYGSEPNKIIGITTGLKDVDKRTLGWQEDDLVIIAARPAMGKTALALQMARYEAEQGIPVGILSLEMSAKKLIYRQIAEKVGYSSNGIMRGDLNHEQGKRNIANAMAHLSQLPIQISDTPSLTIGRIESLVKTWKRKHGIKILYIDYLQLISADPANKGNREQAVSEISRRLKILAKTLHIPIIALSQLSRAVETRGGDKRPMLSDLRESGAIEQDADIVMSLWRPEYYSINDYEGISTEGLAFLDILKFRGGNVTNDLKLKFLNYLTRFSDYSEYNDDVPPAYHEPNEHKPASKLTPVRDFTQSNRIADQDLPF